MDAQYAFRMTSGIDPHSVSALYAQVKLVEVGPRSIGW